MAYPNPMTCTCPDTHACSLKHACPCLCAPQVAFLMTDGDNIQWLLGPFSTSPSWFASPDRGLVPLGWTVHCSAP
jgi:hypothetical protein